MKSEFREVIVPYIFPEGSKQRLLCKFWRIRKTNHFLAASQSPPEH